MISALKWGALIGLGAYAFVNIGLTLLAGALFGQGVPDVNNPGLFSALCLGIFALLFLFSAAGYFTGRDTLRAGLGAVAGMVALVVYAALKALYTPGSSAGATPAPKTTAPALPLAAQIMSVVVSDVLLLAIAALMGWLGGRPGEQRARKRLAASASHTASSAAEHL
ncbi:MAG: hypothetical protein OJF49_000737 [Ktedonobacterales bacterium]|nr:MAG: hypothetical protein OJF49_000737 [Ktedonobacterales bacterium]